LNIMDKRAGGLAALLALTLVTAWMFAAGSGQANWLAWVDLGVGIVVLGGVASTTTYEEQGTATWPMAALILLAMWLFALAAGSPTWLTWVTFAVALGFVLLTGVWLLASAEGPDFQHRHHAHA
jgi:hypothetical protein